MDDYIIEHSQIGPFTYSCRITTPDKIIFVNSNLQAQHPSHINSHSLLHHFKNQKENWIIEMDIISKIDEDFPKIV